MDTGMLVTFVGILIAGLAGVLGVWMERDPDAPRTWAWVFSFLIFIAVGVEMGHSVVQASSDGETEEAMARVLERLTDLAASGDNPALASFVSSELAAQARSNPGVVKNLEKKIAKKGGDPKAIRRVAAAGRRMAAGLPTKKPNFGAAGKGGKGGKDGKGAGKGGKGGKGGKEGKGGGKDGKGGKGGGKDGKGKDGKGKDKDGKDNKEGKGGGGGGGGGKDASKTDAGKTDAGKKDAGKKDAGKKDDDKKGKKGKKDK